MGDDTVITPDRFQESAFTPHYDAVLGFFMRRVREPSMAHDLTQEVFLRVTRLPQDQNVENPKAFLFQVAANLLRDAHRREKARRSTDHIELNDDVHVAMEPNPEEQTSSREELAAFERALAELKPRTRMIFVLHRFEHLPYSEIASRLGISVSAVEKHIAKAAQHFFDRLGRKKGAGR